jgi:Skp family chaperone for outer membrane proteins
MKKIGLLVVFIALLFSCSSETIEVNKEEKNTVPNVVTKDTVGLKIAYYQLDSLRSQFKFYKEQDEIVSQRQLAFQKEIDRRTVAYESYLIQKDGEAKKGLLSENDMVSIQQKAQKMQEDIMKYQQSEGAKIQEEMAKKLEVIDKRIEVMGKQYSEKHKIDLLIAHSKGGQFTFINPSMDVTREFLNFLNENQKSKNK